MDTYLCGMIKTGVLGSEIKSHGKSVSLPIAFGSKHSLLQVANAPANTFGVTSDGKLISVGQGSHGRAGTGSYKTVERFTPIRPALASRVRFVQVSAGGWHGLALASDGTVYQWGYALATHGNQRMKDLLQPTRVPDPASGTGPSASSDTSSATHQAIYVTCGDNCSGYITRDGSLFTWGCGPLGIRPRASKRASRQPPHKMTAEVPTKVHIGASERSRRTAAAASHVSHGEDADASIRVVQADLSQLHGAAVTECGRVWIWGSNQSGCLALGSSRSKTLPNGSYGHMVYADPANCLDDESTAGAAGDAGAAAKGAAGGAGALSLSADPSTAGVGELPAGASSGAGTGGSTAASYPSGPSSGSPSSPSQSLAVALAPRRMGRERSLSHGDATGRSSLHVAHGGDEHDAHFKDEDSEGEECGEGKKDPSASAGDAAASSRGGGHRGGAAEGRPSTAEDRSTGLGVDAGERSSGTGASVGKEAGASGASGRAATGGDTSGGSGAGSSGTSTSLRPFFLQVSCSSGSHHPSTLAVDREGYLWGWGSNYKAKLGGGGYWKHGDKDAYPDPKPMPREWFGGARVARAVSGGIHNACVTEDGVAYSWGCGSDGRMGHPDAVNFRYLYRETMPRPVEWVCSDAKYSPGGSSGSKGRRTVPLGGGKGESPKGWVRVYQPAGPGQGRAVLRRCVRLTSSYRNMAFVYDDGKA